jgi:hypothetical protein
MEVLLWIGSKREKGGREEITEGREEIAGGDVRRWCWVCLTHGVG